VGSLLALFGGGVARGRPIIDVCMHDDMMYVCMSTIVCTIPEVVDGEKS